MKQFYSFLLVRSHLKLPVRMPVVYLTLFVLFSLSYTIQGQTITTNKVDYSPGDVVIVSGKGWQPFENVSLVMKELNFNNPGKTSTIQCNGIGQFSTAYYTVVNADRGAFFHITATGQTSKHVATITFNDDGGSYAIDFSAYDPEIYSKKLPGSVTIPAGFSADGPLGNTYHNQTVEALTPSFLGLGQIVAFEFFIRADAASGCPNDAITFTAQFDTKTGKTGSSFGYDPAYGIYAAFVDREPGGGNIDPGNNATVTNISPTVLGDYFFTGDVTVSGLDPGDEITVEVWVVLQKTMPEGANGNVAAALKDAVTAGSGAGDCAAGDGVNTGNQTINLNQIGEFFTTDVDLNITKTDSQDPVTIGNPFSYTITISNTGPSVANNVVITDVLSSSNLSVGTITYSNGSENWTFNQVGQTLTFSTLSISIGETITITVPVTWTGTYSGTQTTGPAGTGGYGSTCTGDLTNNVSVTTISDDTNLANNSYCQPTNVYCATVDVNAGPDKEITCTVTEVTLEGSSTIPGATFSWVASNGGHIVSGDLTATPVVDAAGTYTLTVTDPVSGCTGTDVALVTLNNTPPNVNAGPDKQLTCLVTQVTLEGSSTTQGATFSWIASGGGHIVSGGSTATPVVDAAGTYTLTVTDPANGCTATDVAVVTVSNTLPNVSAGPDKQLTCLVTQVTLEGSSTTQDATFSWIASGGGNIVSGATTATPLVNAAGTYTLTVTDPTNGCTATDVAVVTVSNTLPNASAGPDKQLTCLVT
ncbi:MAG: DUF11 domain-containing protein, partial [Bacteroidales bacterium]|nr:DUF11 domain-containing protein [Bacteroidales bacterium]